MSAKYVVGLSCIGVKKATEGSKQLLYSFEITWSDESKTSKEVSSEDLGLLRKHLKTELYKNKPEVVIPELPDGKVSGFRSKAKKAEKRKKNIDEFCLQIINLPHVQGKLLAIASQFEARTTNVVTIRSSATELIADTKNQTFPVHEGDAKSERENGFHIAPEPQPEPEVESKKVTPDDDYAQVLPGARKARMTIPPRNNSKLNYVEVEIIAREKRQPREVTSAVYADVVLLQSSIRSDWLKPTVDPEESDTEEEPAPIVPPRTSIGIHEEAKFMAEETEDMEKTEVPVPEPALEMSESAESIPKHPRKQEEGSGKAHQGVFDAAMMSNFPNRTLIPLPPTETPEKCPSSSDVKLSKKELPTADVPNICIVAIRSRKGSGNSTLPFKRNQRAHLLYTTDLWWFINTGEAIGWVPADYWRIVTQDSKTVSGKAMPPYAPWNLGVLGRVECEALLKTGNQSDFLVRESSNSTGHLVLSMKQGDRVHHFEIQLTETGTYLIGHHHFKTIHNVILYYTKHPLFSDETGNVFRLGQLFARRKK